MYLLCRGVVKGLASKCFKQSERFFEAWEVKYFCDQLSHLNGFLSTREGELVMTHSHLSCVSMTGVIRTIRGS